MQTIKADSLQFAIENNFKDLFVFLAKKCGVSHSFSKKISWVNSSPFCWPNFIFNARFAATTLDRDLDEAVTGIKGKILPAFWLVGPETRMPEFGERLQAHGLRQVDSWPGMALELDRVPGPECADGSLQIKIVEDKNDLASWHTVAGQELFPKKKLDFNMFLNVLKEPAVTFFIAYHDGSPAATAMSFVSSGVVGLYMIATAKPHRGRGFGTAITAAALRQARAEGRRLAILQSTQAGFGVYQKLGFKEYCRFDVFWMLGDEYK